MLIGKTSIPKPGESVCGDKYSIIKKNKNTIIAVVDGLGHGPEAAEAAEAACECVSQYSGNSLRQMFDECDRSLKNTRGAAMTVVMIDNETDIAQFAAVGNVEVKSKTHEKISTINSPGIVGRRIRKLNTSNFRLKPRDTIVIHTDGISNKFNLDEINDDCPQAMADKIMENYSRGNDDSTCVVIKY